MTLAGTRTVAVPPSRRFERRRGSNREEKPYQTGPHSLTQREQVITIGDVIGRTLRFEEITPDDARRELGFPRAAMDMLLNAWSAAAGLPAYVTTTVAEVTGTPARTLAEWVRSNKQALFAH